MTRELAKNFLSLSQLQTNTLASESGIVAYFGRPHIVMASAQLVAGSTTTPSGVTNAIDIINDSIAAVGEPGESQVLPFFFNLTRGAFENTIEGNTIASLVPNGQSFAVENAYDVFVAAGAQGIGLTDVTSSNLDALAALNIPADAKALITTEVGQGFGVIVPDSTVELNGTSTISWAEINLATGEYIGINEDGGHEGAFEFLGLVSEGLELEIKVVKYFAPVMAFDTGAVLSVAYELNAGTEGQDEAAERAAAKRWRRARNSTSNSSRIAKLSRLFCRVTASFKRCSGKRPVTTKPKFEMR